MTKKKEPTVCPECKKEAVPKKQFCPCGFNIGYWLNTGKKKVVNRGTFLPYTRFI